MYDIVNAVYSHQTEINCRFFCGKFWRYICHQLFAYCNITLILLNQRTVGDKLGDKTWTASPNNWRILRSFGDEKVIILRSFGNHQNWRVFENCLVNKWRMWRAADLHLASPANSLPLPAEYFDKATTV